MPWWSWIVIWVALVALSLLYVVLLGIKLWRHFVALGREVSQASERVSLDLSQHSGHDAPAGQELLNQHARLVGQRAELREPGWAVHADPSEVKAEYAQGKLDRRAVRRERRIARRAERGQPQSLSDLRHSGTDLTR